MYESGEMRARWAPQGSQKNAGVAAAWQARETVWQDPRGSGHRLTQGILVGSAEKLGLILAAAKVGCAALQAVDRRG